MAEIWSSNIEYVAFLIIVQPIFALTPEIKNNKLISHRIVPNGSPEVTKKSLLRSEWGKYGFFQFSLRRVGEYAKNSISQLLNEIQGPINTSK